MHLRRTLARPAAALGAAGLVTLAIAAPASAHVTVSASDTAAGAYTVLTFSVPHGCDGSATTKIDISIPEGINAVTPTRNSFYSVAKSDEQLDPPVTDAHGNELTERVATVTYTAKTPLPDGYRDTFELSLQLPEDAAGQTLAFPIIQTCEQGSTPWTEVVADGEEEPEHPAPTVTVTEATGEDHHDASAASHEEGEGEAAEATTAAATSSEDGDGNGNGLAIAGLATGVVGILVGGAALARSGRKA